MLKLNISCRNEDEDEHGFTLLELVVAVLVVGIIFAIAVPVYNSQQRTVVKNSIASDVMVAKMKLDPLLADMPEDVARLTAVTTTQDNTVTLIGSWSDYYVIGSNSNVNGYRFCYHSRSNEYGENECPTDSSR